MAETQIPEKRYMQIELTKKIGTLVDEFKKLGGEKQFKIKQRSLDWARINGQLVELIGEINRLADDPKTYCENLWHSIQQTGEGAGLFETAEGFISYQNGMLMEVAAEKVLQKVLNSQCCHATPERDVFDDCDLVIPQQTKKEGTNDFCFKIELFRDCQRQPDVIINQDPYGGQSAYVAINYQDEPMVFFERFTGKPTDLLEMHFKRDLKGMNFGN